MVDGREPGPGQKAEKLRWLAHLARRLLDDGRSQAMAGRTESGEQHGLPVTESYRLVGTSAGEASHLALNQSERVAAADMQVAG